LIEGLLVFQFVAKKLLALWADSFTLTQNADDRTVAQPTLFLHPFDEVFRIATVSKLLSVDLDDPVGVDCTAVPISFAQLPEALYQCHIKTFR